MIYQVRWSQAAINELTTAWMNADQEKRRAITAAAHQIDLILQHDPANKCESRPQDQRVFMHAPVGVLFEVQERLGVAWINQAWVFRTH